MKKIAGMWVVFVAMLSAAVPALQADTGDDVFENSSDTGPVIVFNGHTPNRPASGEPAEIQKAENTGEEEKPKEEAPSKEKEASEENDIPGDRMSEDDFPLSASTA
ncbi:MAG: hypothetical protein A2Z83_01570 [Omnitrophica bacterium GWA2_52_8]|nr:MAG: hypothetical protein A2Z83_01570 [Omnitrophica bacterium GWA2_52_8]